MKLDQADRFFDGPEAALCFAALYGADGASCAPRRYKALAQGLARMDGASEGGGGEGRFFTAAGRTELCGNHTDHNLGRVIAASVQVDAAAAASPRNDSLAVFRSTGFPDVKVDLADLSPREAERGTTEALLRGIAAAFVERGAAARGFTVNADSTVPKGSGLSSSAACEVLLAKIYDCLNFTGKTQALELAKIAQGAENRYFGKPCGLMDQGASASGGAVMFDFGKDPVGTRSFTFNLEDWGYTLCVVDTGGTHADLTGDYAAIPAEMKAAAAVLGKKVLGEASKEALLARAGAVREACGDRAFLRALHFFNENERVGAFAKALEGLSSGKPGGGGRAAETEALFDCVNRSGHSSWELLQNISPARDAGGKQQNVALALGLTQDFLAGKCGGAAGGGAGNGGACRVHGGGFAGTIQAYIPAPAFTGYQALMEGVFGRGAVTRLFIRPVGTAELFAQGGAL